MMEALIFDSFRDYLLRTVRTREKYVPYYLKWVGDCYAYLQRGCNPSLYSI